MGKTYAILNKTKIGAYFRTTVPQDARKLLGLERGDEIVWIQEGEKVIVDKARKEMGE
jgi:bifunctional DNA-binding transcriptional regulator/antitoxin component of YhaV-PrlF toxin-antitoxin module